MPWRRAVSSRGFRYMYLCGRALAPPQCWADLVGLTPPPPMMVRKGVKYEEKPELIRILMVPNLSTFQPPCGGETSEITLEMQISVRGFNPP